MAYNRRRFIKTAMISASALATTALFGCGSDNKQAPTPAPTTPTAPSLLDGTSYFPQSVMSGDPRPDSVILWTRLASDSADDQSLTLQIASDESFSEAMISETVMTQALHDHCVKVRITDLNADSHYYYRFITEQGGKQYVTRTGRTKTAPALDSTRQVKFAAISCQDYIGRYYNNFLSLLEHDDLDFVMHLGDYIYETTGDSSFQQVGGERSITFTDSDGALTIGVGDNTTQAANSLSNYRQLYQTYRSDKLLQQVHEKFPMIAIWDDHEFSDDSWQDNASYLDGAEVERQTQRKINAEQVYFEYMAIDHEQPHLGDSLAQGALNIDETMLYPNTRIYRDFHFGQNLHLAMTDFRTYRPDHLIPEDTFPATVAIDQATLSGFLTATGMSQAQIDGTIAMMSPYVDIDQAQFAPYKASFIELFTGLYAQALANKVSLSPEALASQASIRAQQVVQGNLATSYLNTVLAQAQQALPAEHPIQQLPLLPETGTEQGLAFYTLGKTQLFDFLGSRYFVIKDSFDLYAAYKGYVASLQGQNVQNGYGDAQTAWLTQTFASSTSTWKVLGSSVSWSPLMFDLSASRADSGLLALEGVLSSPAIPAQLKQRFYLEADQWDGFPQFKQQFSQDVLSQYGVISLAGDIHSAYVSEYQAHPVTGLKAFNFTTSSVSSGTFSSFLQTGMNDLLSQLGDVPEQINQLPLFFDTLVKTASNRDDVAEKVNFARMDEHGIAIVTATTDNFTVDFYNVTREVNGQDTMTTSYYDAPQNFLAMVNHYQFIINNNMLNRTV